MITFEQLITEAKAYGNDWHITLDGGIECGTICPLGVLILGRKVKIHPQSPLDAVNRPQPKGAARALSIPLGMARRIAKAADNGYGSLGDRIKMKEILGLEQ